MKLFLLASVLVSASLIPVVLSATSNPPLVVPERMSLGELASIVPTDAPLFGSMLLQWPIGWISDRASRRGVILAVAGIAVATCVALAGVTEGSWIAVGLMAVLGAVSFPIYSLTIALTADWLPTAKLTSGSAVLVRVNGVGALVGPLVATVVIGSTSPIAYFWSMAAINLVIAAYLVWRIVVADAPEHPRTFVAFPARASAGAIALMRGQRTRIDNEN